MRATCLAMRLACTSTQFSVLSTTSRRGSVTFPSGGRSLLSACSFICRQASRLCGPLARDASRGQHVDAVDEFEPFGAVGDQEHGAGSSRREDIPDKGTRG